MAEACLSGKADIIWKISAFNCACSLWTSMRRGTARGVAKEAAAANDADRVGSVGQNRAVYEAVAEEGWWLAVLMRLVHASAFDAMPISFSARRSPLMLRSNQPEHVQAKPFAWGTQGPATVKHLMPHSTTKCLPGKSTAQALKAHHTTQYSLSTARHTCCHPHTSHNWLGPFSSQKQQRTKQTV